MHDITAAPGRGPELDPQQTPSRPEQTPIDTSPGPEQRGSCGPCETLQTCLCAAPHAARHKHREQQQTRRAPPATHRPQSPAPAPASSVAEKPPGPSNDTDTDREAEERRTDLFSRRKSAACGGHTDNKLVVLDGKRRRAKSQQPSLLSLVVNASAGRRAPCVRRSVKRMVGQHRDSTGTASLRGPRTNPRLQTKRLNPLNPLRCHGQQRRLLETPPCAPQPKALIQRVHEQQTRRAHAHHVNGQTNP
uniref:Uncharacterized protein n=1 Tax=Knipowitschia caucasica TaxID=637954 RepID=A0AAV2J5N6_KNICA